MHCVLPKRNINDENCDGVTLDSGETPHREGFSDTNFAADKADRKSMTEGVLRLNGMAVRWSARKQGGVSLYTPRERSRAR